MAEASAGLTTAGHAYRTKDPDTVTLLVAKQQLR